MMAITIFIGLSPPSLSRCIGRADAAKQCLRRDLPPARYRAERIKPHASSAEGSLSPDIPGRIGYCAGPQQGRPRPPARHRLNITQNAQNRSGRTPAMFAKGCLERVGAGLAGADAEPPIDGPDKNLAVADLSGLGRRADRLDGSAGIFVADCDLDPYFWQKMHHRLGAAIDFGMALLPPVTADFGDGHAL